MKRKEITIGLCLPVSCTVEVEESDDGDLTIKSVRRLDCNASVRTITEQMDDDEFDAMRTAFDRAPIEARAA